MSYVTFPNSFPLVLHPYVSGSFISLVKFAESDGLRVRSFVMYILPLILLSIILPFRSSPVSVPLLGNYNYVSLTWKFITPYLRFGPVFLLTLVIPSPLLIILIIRELLNLRLSYLAIRDVHEG
jgi:hypothetical protein